MSLAKLKQIPLLRAIFYPYILIKRYFIKKDYESFYKQVDRVLDLVRTDSLDLELKDFKGVFSVGKDSLLLKFIIKEGCYEPDLVKLVEKHLDPQKDAIDIGANVGFFSVFMGKTIGSGQRVLSIEPTPGALQRLKLNLRNNGVENVVLFEGALGENAQNVTFNVVPGCEEYSSLKPIAHQHALEFETQEINIPCRPLDDLIQEHGLCPGFIKMDVEGAEHEVLKGSAKVLKNHKPTILTELDEGLLQGFGTNCDAVIKLLDSYGYNVVDADTGGPFRPGISGSALATA